jgi:hypothetical protein
MKHSTRVLRPKKIYGVGGKIEVGRTTFFDNYVHHEGGDEFIPGTEVRRLRLVSLGPRAVGAFEDEVDALIEALRAKRDAAKG